MGLVASAATLAAALVTAGLIADPAGITKAGGLALALATWVASNAQFTNLATPPGTMVASGSACSGFGKITFLNNGDDFGQHMASSIPATDPAGIAKWKALGNGLVNHMKSNGQVNASTFGAPPAGGPVTGTASVSFTTTTFSPTLAADLGLTDATGVSVWANLGTAILAFIAASGQAVPAPGLAAPSGGGPLTGVGSIN